MLNRRGDHQRFSVERPYILDSENWVAQIESHKEKNINDGAKPREEDEEKERRGEEARGKEQEKKEEERRRNWKVVKGTLHWIVWHSRNPPVLVTTLLTLCTLLYCIFKARATCIRIPRVHTILVENICALVCTNTRQEGGDSESRARGTASGKEALKGGPYLQSSYMCTRGRPCPLFYLLFVRTHRYRSCLFEDHVNGVARGASSPRRERIPLETPHVNLFPTWIFFCNASFEISIDRVPGKIDTINSSINFTPISTHFIL